MKISLLAAMDLNRGIGIDNHLPWRLSADLRRFKELTMGHHIILGRKTYESIGYPLPGRFSIIVTRNPDYRAEGCFITHSPQEALALARSRGEGEAFVIGGAQIFADTLPDSDRFYLTWVHTPGPADTFFPHFDLDEWQEISSEQLPADENNQFETTYVVLEKIKTPGEITWG